jgi:hypothetical protein
MRKAESAMAANRSRWGERVGRVALLAAIGSLLWPAAGISFDDGADGHFEKRTSSHFVLYQDVDIDQTSGFRGSRRFEQQVLDTLEKAYKSVDRQLGIRAPRPITVVIYDPVVFEAEFSGLFRFPAAGFYGGRIHIRGDTVLTDRLVAVLHHELVHATYDGVAPNLILPAWLNEGTAEWVEARSMGKRGPHSGERAFLAQVASQGQLFSLAQMSAPSFGQLGPRGAQLAYVQSYATIDYLTRKHGERSIRELIDDLMRSRNLERSVRRTYREDIDELEREIHQAFASGR